MDKIDLTPHLHTLFTPRPRTIGRYHASELYGITHGWVTPKDILRPKQVDDVSALRMWQGTWKHQQVQELLTLAGYTHETKKEYAYNGWVLVAKLDSEKEDHLLEIKTSDTVFTEAKTWHTYQTKLYCTIFEKPNGMIVQPIIRNGKVELQVIGTVERDDDWFAKQIAKLDLFHTKVIQTKSK